MTRPIPQPWHELTAKQRQQAIAAGWGKPMLRGAHGREVVEPGWRWLVNDQGQVISVQPRDVAVADFFSPPVERKRLEK